MQFLHTAFVRYKCYGTLSESRRFWQRQKYDGRTFLLLLIAIQSKTAVWNLYNCLPELYNCEQRQQRKYLPMICFLIQGTQHPPSALHVFTVSILAADTVSILVVNRVSILAAATVSIQAAETVSIQVATEMILSSVASNTRPYQAPLVAVALVRVVQNLNE